ncbi:MAG TPA: translation elongation factor 4 [Candidatus Paceibacterota bacterium]|nr:translation elongation factor 4 [Candidatus Pacearchaeota archaeon]HPC30514.1 translation elongation factor 4 [Candidatus Pacearchaeota archaeon]HRR94661.1 translation elongation factor 4 [Candidatus Paceibacterota bacterium]HRU20837.1 translation elongation factor 4 [Candidatus Paceibacterota bacterium]
MKIRNFVIISHIDHGKSTLADRFLEITGTVQKNKMRAQYLDAMDIEREKGITIKMTPVRMFWKDKYGEPVMLNLIDTPGHIDFNYEVSRSLAAVEGAILLVDATKGIQAQTITNLELAKQQGLVIIPVINKIDSPAARIDDVRKEIVEFLQIDPASILYISAKTGENVETLLEAVIEKIPEPPLNIDKPLRALIFDSSYDSFLGVVAYVRIMEGTISSNEKLLLVNSKINGLSKEIGIFTPDMKPIAELKAGEIGYIATGIKETEKSGIIGDTITINNSDIKIEPLPGYKEPEPKIFVSVYPEEQSEFEQLKIALAKLKLNDSALFYQQQNFYIFGRGFLCGFLGTLHAEITMERLRREFGLEIVIGAPQVAYKAIDAKGQEVMIYNPLNWSQSYKKFFEPWAEVKIIINANYLGRVFDYLSELKGKHIESYPFGSDRYMLIYEMPLREIIGKFYENLLNITQGFASLTYKEIEYRETELVKLEILVAGKPEEALSRILPKEEAVAEARRVVQKLKDLLPRQSFAVPLQGKIGGTIVSRETLSAYRKDVIAPLYGGDYTRKRKLLEKQKKGKSKMKEKGEVHIPPEVFLKVFGS